KFIYGITEDMQVRSRREAELLRAETRYQELFKNATEGIYQSHPDGYFINVNPAMAQILGYSSARELMETTRDIANQFYVSPDVRLSLIEKLKNDGRFTNIEAQVYKKDGSRIWVSENSRAVYDEKGKLRYLEGTIVDITSRKAAETALQQSEEKYRTLVHHIQDGVFIMQHSRYVYVNNAFADMLGYTTEEMIGMNYVNIVAPESRPEQEERRKRRQEGYRDTLEYEINLLHKDGNSRVLVTAKVGAINYNNDVATIGTVRNITTERKNQNALAEAERKYRSIFENAAEGIYQTSIDGKFISANPALAWLLGYNSAQELVEHTADISTQVYVDPHHRNRLLKLINEKGSVKNVEAEIYRRGGTTIWISENSKILRDDDGNPLWYEGTLVDITSRKLIEAALQESEEKYRALVETSHVGVFISRRGKHVYCNNAYASMLGYTEEELIGLSYRDVIAPEDLSAADERYARRSRNENVPNDYEVRLLHKDGQTRIIATVSIGVVEQKGEKIMMGTVRDITEQKRVERQLRHNATHDPLTGLPNRTLFIERLSKAMAFSHRPDAPNYAVLFLDLDSFKVVNDSLGHAMGDQLLIEISHRLKKCLRPWDTIARHGGDEFTILIEQLHSVEDAVDVAERIHNELANPFKLGEHEVFSNASIGIALGDPVYTSTEEVLRDADTAMYQSKENRKAGYVIFDKGMHYIAKARLQLETELRQALERNEFRIYYQPIVNLRNRKLVGFEALLRWQHASRGLLLPGDFLSVAEETGLILPIGWWVMRTACMQMADWQNKFSKARQLSISINIADKQFSHPDLPGRTASALRDAGLRPESLHMEITETVFMENPEAAGEMLGRLKALGVGLHTDDFGTGYSSLGYLSKYPLDSLKIDRSFVADLVENKSHRAIVKTIIQLANALDMETIAEGIESQQQANLLKKIGCPLGQGTNFSEPINLEKAESLLSARLGVIKI
ncbi:MAG: PAS domain S-box protein, partial [Gammaproteobacteria bacterium]|nr:PAS domain S-box protein [Gammaproteobacteria bacterium]